MKYDLKEHGLIDEDGKVTLAGRIVLESVLASSASSYSEEFEPKYSSCWNKDSDEIINWEKENKAVCIPGSNEGLIEVTPIKFYCEDSGVRVWEKQERLSVVMVDDMFNSEAHITIYSKENAIALRDYLTKFIEKEEDWYKIPNNL